MLEQSRAVLAQVDAIDKRARALIAGAVGNIRIGATPQIMQSLIAGFLAGYGRSQPGVEISLTEAGGVRLLDLLRQGDLDLAVSGILAGTRFASRLLFPIRLLAVAAAGPRWRGRSTLEIVELAHQPLLLLGRDFGTRQLFDAACRLAHLRPRCVLEGTEPHSLIALAEAGHGIAVVPSTVRFMSKMIWIMPILQDRKSLGTWSTVSWDARRAFRPTRWALLKNSTPIAVGAFQESSSAESHRWCRSRQTTDPSDHQLPPDHAKTVGNGSG